jgi:hypothetical protein
VIAPESPPKREVLMKTTRRLLIGLTVSVLLPTAAMAQKVAYDFKHNGDFRNLKTFAFRDVPSTIPYSTPAGTPKGSPHGTPKGTPAGTPSGTPYGPYQNGSFTEKTTVYDSPFVAERTRRAIASELERRGMREDDQNPDVLVTTRRTFRDEPVLYGPSGWGPYGWGWYGWGWGYGGPWYTENIIKGTLIVDIQDARTGGLLWRGLREKTVHPHQKPGERTEQVYEDVNKIFRKFPELGSVATSGITPSGVSSPRSGEGEGR